MKPLDDFAQQHPLATGAIGVVSSLAGWVLDNVAQINAVATLIGTLIGVAVGAFTLLILIRKWRRGRDQRRKYWQDVQDDFDNLD